MAALTFINAPIHRRALHTALLAPILLLSVSATSIAEAPFVHNGQAGFVVSDFAFALADDAEKTGACPSGFVKSDGDKFASSPDGRQRPGESNGEYEIRVRRGATQLGSSADGKSLCAFPELGLPDPDFQTVELSNMSVAGFDLDENISNKKAIPAPASCAHTDFTGQDGQFGVDNQFYRVVGCSRSFQSTGLSNGFATTMLTGSWGILIKLSDIDDLENDDHVIVGVYANADPIMLSPQRAPLSYATYALHQDPRLRSEGLGRIVDGVLITEPMDINVQSETNSMIMERQLRDARLRVEIDKNGQMTGLLGGYSPVENIYDVQYGYRSAKTDAGSPSPEGLRLQSAHGASFVLGHTCYGAYHALKAHADGHPDPETGSCTSISTQYRLKAIPAFLVDIATTSQNAAIATGELNARDIAQDY